MMMTMVPNPMYMSFLSVMLPRRRGSRRRKRERAYQRLSSRRLQVCEAEAGTPREVVQPAGFVRGGSPT